MKAIICFTTWAVLASAAAPDYPKTRKVDHKDTYHGTEISDPYRWLEDDRSTETAAWVRQQNRVTFDYLNAIPGRAGLLKRLEQLNNFAKESAPFRRGEFYFFTRNSGLQNQDVWYVRRGLDGAPELLIDPNTFSQDGTTKLMNLAVSRDGRYAAFGLSQGGSDWQEIRVMEIASRRMLPDRIQWVKGGAPSFRGDGFYYSRYPAPPSGQELSSKNEFQTVHYHRLGTAQAEDTLVYEDRAHPLRFHRVRVLEGEQVAILSISERGRAALGEAIHWRDETRPGAAFQPLFPDISDTEYSVVDYDRGRFMVVTNHQAPNFKLVSVDPASPAPAQWKTVIAERKDPLQAVRSAGGKLFALFLRDVSSHVEVLTLDGKLENTIALPGPGIAGGFGGLKEDTSVYYSFNSFLSPSTIYRYDIARKQSALHWKPRVEFPFENYETRRVFFPSKDGTQVPMFITHRKGLRLNGQNPVLIFGYGGFSISQTPAFNPDRLALIERGVVYASVCLRGGLEYGEKWHTAGMREKKQNVFDDFISAAEYLIREKYTSPGKLACQGGSNGGLLVGAVINQRPELFRVALPAVGVMDMLRFQKFTIGWNWVAEYGSSDNAADFRYLRAYSPLHNVRQGAKYPATLVTTADHDDRVVPAHSFKYAATMQEKAAKDRPVLIRVEVNSGHGASSTAKRLAITADIYSFLLHNLEVERKPND